MTIERKNERTALHRPAIFGPGSSARAYCPHRFWPREMPRTFTALLTCAFAASLRAASPGAVMPTLPAETLAGKQVSVPIDLPNVPCVLIVGFPSAPGLRRSSGRDAWTAWQGPMLL